MMNILIIFEGQLGDILVLSPAFRALKSSYPDSTITALVKQRKYLSETIANRKQILNFEPAGGTIEMLKSNPNINRIVEVDWTRLSSLKGLDNLKTNFSIFNFLRKDKYDIAIATFPNDRFTFWAFASRAKIRVGQKNQPFSFLLTHKPNIEFYDKGVLHYFCELVKASGATVKSYKTEYHTSTESKLWAEEFIKKHRLDGISNLVAIHPGSLQLADIWPSEKYAAIIDNLQDDGSTRILLCKTCLDNKIISKIKEHLKTNIVEVDTDGNIDQFAAILEQCKLCISNDSGPRHLAIAIGIPSLAFISKLKFNTWRIYEEDQNIITLPHEFDCPECSGGKCEEIIPDGETFGATCIRSVSVLDVFERAKQLLSQN